MAGRRMGRRLSLPFIENRRMYLPFVEKSEYKLISTEIERQIKRDRKRSLKEVKILVLGAAESGKSTFTKQMKVIQGSGFNAYEREEAKEVILSNLVTSTCIILKCYIEAEKEKAERVDEKMDDTSFSMKQFVSKQGIKMLTVWKDKCFPSTPKEVKSETNFLQLYGEELLAYLTPEEASCINYYLRQFLVDTKVCINGQHLLENERRIALLRNIFDDYKFTEVLLSWNMFKLPDSALHFFAHADRILEEKYVPSNEDILRMRKPTSGIIETVITFGDVAFRLVDAGGQRTERKKWIHCFEDVSSLIFIASLAEYHQTLVEDPTANRLQESVALFKTISNIPWIKQSSIILFFNKKDIFKEKIKYFKFKNTFEDFVGDETDLFETITFIVKLFTDIPQTHR